MMEELLKRLSMALGVSGHEENVSRIVEEELAPYVDKAYRDRFGNLVLEKEGHGEGPRILIMAHIDEIGGMVKHVDDKGFLYFVGIGSHDPHQLLGSRVLVGDGMLGVVQKKNKKKEFGIEDLFIDVGANGKEELEKMGVGIGTVFSSVPSYAVLLGTRRVSKSFDNRAGVYVMTEVVKTVGKFNGKLIAVASCQEEVELRGAKVVSNYIDADIAFALDVTFAFDNPQGQSEKDVNTFLGRGPAITLKDDHIILRPKMREFIEGVAKKAKVPLQYDISTGGTDAGALNVSKGATPTAAILIPLRYMHTGNEVIDLKDLDGCIRLLRGLIEGIDSYGI